MTSGDVAPMPTYAILEPLDAPARAAYAALCSREEMSRTAIARTSLSATAFAAAEFRLTGEVRLAIETDELPIQPGYIALDLRTGHLRAPGENLQGPHLYALLGFPAIGRLTGETAHFLYLVPQDWPRAKALLAAVVPKDVVDVVLPSEGAALPICLTMGSLVRLALASLEQNRFALRAIFEDIEAPV